MSDNDIALGVSIPGVSPGKSGEVVDEVLALQAITPVMKTLQQAVTAAEVQSAQFRKNYQKLHPNAGGEEIAGSDNAKTKFDWETKPALMEAVKMKLEDTLKAHGIDPNVPEQQKFIGQYIKTGEKRAEDKASGRLREAEANAVLAGTHSAVQRQTSAPITRTKP